ncbi:MAG: anti-sigma factor [candidate division WOR-3 bacterium]
MISCYQLSLLMTEFIDGELSDELCYEVRQHMMFCPDCRKEHEQYIRLLTFFHCHCTLQVPEEVHTELIQLIQEEYQKTFIKKEKKTKIKRPRRR